jgi:phage N-6-adenine-methyltransferase
MSTKTSSGRHRIRRWEKGDVTDDRATHPLNFQQWDEQFGPFTLDVAAAAHNAKCERYFDREQDGLAQSWAGETVWCNPPYSEIGLWVRKAWAEHVDATRIVMLLPATRTEQSWWQLMVEPFRDRPGSPLEVRFMPGRMYFLRPGQTAIQSGERPPFGCVLLLWDRMDGQRLVYHSDAVTGGLFS